MVLGVRGIPSVQGGVETHAEQLYERLSHMDCEVEVLVRTPFVPPTRTSFGSIRLRLGQAAIGAVTVHIGK